MTIEIILPNGRRQQYKPRSSVRAGTLATNLAKKWKFWRKGDRWQLRGPIGEIDARQQVRYIELNVGESLKLEKKE